MLTQTTLAAIRTLVHIGLNPGGKSLSIRHIAEILGESPTYLAKVARHLVKAGILKASRGVTGGIMLNRSPKAITLLAIVEACQGAILADFCQETSSLKGACAFHVAAVELHQAIIQVLGRWTLDQFIKEPGSSGSLRAIPCLLHSRSGGKAKLSRAKSSRRETAKKGAAGRTRSPHSAR